MLKKIEALRKEPVSVRNRWAFWIALSVTLCIAFFWVSTLPARFAPVQADETKQDEGASWSETVGSLTDSFTQTFQNFRANVEYVKEPSETDSQINTLDLDALFKASSTPTIRQDFKANIGSTSTTTQEVE